jgi:hypothetical protein
VLSQANRGRVESVAVLACLGALAAGCGGTQGPAPPSGLPTGAYNGTVECKGSDTFSNGDKTQVLDAPVDVTATFDDDGLADWTYVFLGDKNPAIESDAVQPGDTFGYVAGRHIGKPGRTKITVLDSEESDGEVRIVAALDWASKSTGYVGSGTYSLRLRTVGDSALEYQSHKVVVKLPEVSQASEDEPMVRRTEICEGELT